MGWIQIAITLLCCFLTQTNAEDPCILDLAFVLDASASMTNDWIHEIEFVADVVKQVNVSFDGSHIAIVQFGSDSNVVMTFDDGKDKDYVVGRVRNLPGPKRFATTQLHLALRDALEKVFNKATNSYRTEDDVRKVVLIVTDGAQTPPGDPHIPADKLKKRGFEIYAIGAGASSQQKHELELLQNKGAYFIRSASKIRYMALEVAQAICPTRPSIELKGDAFVFAGRSHDFDCAASSLFSTTVKWLRNDRELFGGEMNQTILLENKTEWHQFNLTLRFYEMELRHTGNYTCEATNKHGTNRRTISVTVSCPPILPILSDLKPEVGSNGNVTLKCEAYRLDHKQRYSYQWKWKFNDDGEIKEDANGKYQIFSGYSAPDSCHQSKGWVALRVRNVSSQDLGQYKCVLLMPGMIFGEKNVPYFGFASLNVPSHPEHVTLATVECGRTIHVQWKSSAEHQITGYQLKLKSLDESIQHVLLNLSSNVNSKKLHVKSNTIYEVHIRAQNSAGFSLWTKKQQTTAVDVPKEFDVTANPSGCYAELSWEALIDNSCPITGYTVHFREYMTSTSNKRNWQTNRIGNMTDYRLQLNCSKDYEVLVIAWNERGSSYADEKVAFVRTQEGLPFRPEWSNVEENQCGQFVVTWHPSSLDSGGGPLTGFQVQITEETSGDWSNCTNVLTNHSCLFKGLQSETEYNIRVRAFNQKGSGEWSTTWSNKTGLIGRPDPPQITNQTEVSGSNATVLWTRPSHRNCNITMYSLHYRVIKPTIKNWVEINITDSSITNYTLYLQHSKKYEVIVFAWNALGRSEKSEAWEIETAQHVPYQPIMHSDFIGGCSSFNVTWSPPAREALGGLVTGYLAQIRSAMSDETWINYTEFNNPQSTSCMFTHMKTNSKYDVRVLAKNGMGYGWPSEILQASTSQPDRPDNPEIIDINEQVCDITIKWSKPSSNGCPILFYTIRYKEQKAHQGANDWEDINVTDPSNNQRELQLKCSTTYEFQVVASNEIGKSFPSTVRSATTGRDTVTAGDEGLSMASIVIIVFTIAGLALAAILLFIGVRYCKKRNKRPEKWTAKDIQVLDHCEIPPIRTEFIELLGQGAFGKVHKAKLKDGLEYFAIEKDWVNAPKRRQKIVAVKELHENANEEEKREFMDEIDLMKEVGKHMNVLSFLGCWTTTKPLYLIIEYIAHGDLLHWLRRKRRQITGSTLGAAVAVPKDKELYAGTRTQITAANQDGKERGVKADMMEERLGPSTVLDVTDQGQSGGDDSNECKIPMIIFTALNQEESTPPAREETDDECDDDCESFDPFDLMSFTRQIARGMSYLSEKGLVHRDLAARNILVGHGKKLKIADFGLMREVYHEIYEVKSHKKLPIKWMAPESIYEQIFTLKSDVWSCGVVMWEIATLGGAPYPLLSNTEIMSLLKTEYRMAKPDLCSDNFYALMTECWKQNPKERPSFQELVERLEQLMLQEVEYFDFNLVDETKDYYQVQESKTGEVSCGTKFGW